MGAGAPKQEECPPPRLFFIFPQSLDGFTRSGGSWAQAFARPLSLVAV